MKPQYRSCSSLTSVPAHPHHHGLLFLVVSGIIALGIFTHFSVPSLFAATNVLEDGDDVGTGLDMVLDGRGFPVLSYVDKTNGELKMTHCENAACTVRTVATIDAIRTVSGDTSLVLDSSGFPVFSYYDVVNRDLRYIRCTNANCTSTANAKVLLSSGDVGIHSDMFRWNNNGSNGGDNFIIVAYDATKTALVSAICFGLECGGLGTATLDNTASVGRYPSIVPLSNTSELPRIAYFDETNGALKISFCSSFLDDSTCVESATISVPGAIVGTFSSISLDSDGNPVVSFYDQTHGDLLLIHCSTENCSDKPVVRTLDSVGNIGAGTSLALNSKGNPVVAYYDVTNTALKLITCGDSNCGSGNRITTPESANAVGEFPSIRLTSLATALVSYYDRSNGNLRFTNITNLPPTGLANFTVGTRTSTSIALGWTSVEDDNFDHYEIWYGTKQTDVNGRTGSAKEWDNSPNDLTLGSSVTMSTTITRLPSNKKYYFKIWARDASGGEMTLGAINARTLNDN